MSQDKSWVLTDVDNGVWVESLDLDAGQLGVSGAAHVTKKTLHGGLCDGVDVVEVNNGALSFTVVPTRGMGLWRGAYHGHALGWRAPVRGPVNPRYVHANERGGLGWLGGFNECIVRCGLESNGAPCTDVIPGNTGEPTEVQLGLHGRIANLPAHYVEVKVRHGNPPELCIMGVVDESMLFSPKLRLTTCISTRIGSNAFTISDCVTNLSATPEEMELLYHCNFGPPFLEKGTQFVVPASETAPRDAGAAEDIDGWARYVGPTPGFVEKCYWHVPLADAEGRSVAMLKNAAGDKGVAVRFNVNELPCFTQWKNCAAEEDGYVTGLEPATNLPNPRTLEREKGRVITLAPGQEHKAALTIEAHDHAVGVRHVEDEIAAIQGDRPHTVHAEPQAAFSG